MLIGIKTGEPPILAKKMLRCRVVTAIGARFIYFVVFKVLHGPPVVRGAGRQDYCIVMSALICLTRLRSATVYINSSAP